MTRLVGDRRTLILFGSQSELAWITLCAIPFRNALVFTRAQRDPPRVPTISLAIDLWTEQTVHELVRQQVTESLTVEFKRDMPFAQPGDRREVAKDVSAMANSAGGWLIYGVDERAVGQHGTKVAAAVTPLTGPPNAGHWIDDVVAGLVTPRPRIRVRELVTQGGVLVVVYVAPSSDDLYMVNERYYRRTEQGARPMTEPEIRQAYTIITRRRVDAAAYTRSLVDAEMTDSPKPGVYVALVPQTFGEVLDTAALDIRTPAFQVLGTEFLRFLGPTAIGCEALIPNTYRFRIRRDGTISTSIRAFDTSHWFPDNVLLSVLEVLSVARTLWREFSIHQPSTLVLRVRLPNAMLPSSRFDNRLRADPLPHTLDIDFSVDVTDIELTPLSIAARAMERLYNAMGLKGSPYFGDDKKLRKEILAEIQSGLLASLQ